MRPNSILTAHLSKEVSCSLFFSRTLTFESLPSPHFYFTSKAFPERSFALIVTLVLELPTMFLISGGSDRLCNLIGRWKYTTLISLLPICSAISGNVGLQASTLTTRAISHNQVRVENYSSWLCKEVFAAVYLGKIFISAPLLEIQNISF